MRTPLRHLLAGLAVLALTGTSAVLAQSNQAETKQTEKPAVKPVRSIPYVWIRGDEGRQRHYETNAIPLLFNRACFGWRMYLGGPNRTVSLKEVLTTSQPAEQVIAGPETEVSADKTRATTRMLETVQDGVLQRSWCIIPGDPPGTYTYDITIDAEPRGAFLFCAIESPTPPPPPHPPYLPSPNNSP